MSRVCDIRFAVTDGVRRSAIWICFPDRRPERNDVYLTTKELGGAFKVSFHESGISRAAWDSSFWEGQEQAASEDRLIDRWHGPSKDAFGIAGLYTVLIPRLAVTIDLRPPISPQPFWIPTGRADQSVAVDILLTSSTVIQTPGCRAVDARPVGRIPLISGDQIWVTYRYLAGGFDIPPPAKVSKLSPRGKLKDLDEGLRSVFHGWQPDGKRYAVDFAYSREYAEEFARLNHWLERIPPP